MRSGGCLTTNSLSPCSAMTAVLAALRCTTPCHSVLSSVDNRNLENTSPPVLLLLLQERSTACRGPRPAGLPQVPAQ